MGLVGSEQRLRIVADQVPDDNAVTARWLSDRAVEIQYPAAAWSGCGVTFRVPEGWETAPEGKPAKGTCAVGISPKGWRRQ